MMAYFKRLLITLAVVLLFNSNGLGQAILSRYFNDNSFSLLDLSDHLDPEFKWTLTGNLQFDMNEGLTELKEGNKERAILLLDKVIESDSSFWPAFYYRGISKKNLFRFDDAQKDLEKALRLTKKVFEIYLELGEIYNVKKQFSRSKRQYEAAQELAPNSVLPIYSMGTLSLSQGDVAKATRLYEKCNEIDPNFAPAYVNIAILNHRNDKDLSKGIQLFDKALEANPNFRPALFWRAVFYYQNKEYEKSLENWNKLIQKTPENILALQLRGLLAMEMGKYEDAFSDLRKAGQLMKRYGQKPSGETIFSRRLDLQQAIAYVSKKGYGYKEETFAGLKKSFCQLLLRKLTDAIDELTEINKSEPNSAGYFLKGMVFREMDRIDSALSNYDKALLIDNDIYDAHLYRATYRIKKNDLKGAYSDLMELKRIEPLASSTYRQSGLLKAEINDPYGCIVDLSAFIKEDSTDLEIWVTRAKCRSSVKDYAGSNDDYYAAVKLKPSEKRLYTQIHNNNYAANDTVKTLAHLQEMNRLWPNDIQVEYLLADLYIRFKKYDLASSLAKKISITLPYYNADPASGMFLKARISADTNNAEEALRQLNKSIKTRPDYDRIFYRAKLQLKMGKKKEAVEDLRLLKGVNYGPANKYYDEYLKN